LRISNCGFDRSIRDPQSAIRNLLSHWVHADEFSFASLLFVLNNASYKREQSVIGTAANIVAGLELRAALANQDRATRHCLAAESLDAKPLRV